MRLAKLHFKIQISFRFENSVRSQSVFKLNQSDLNQTWKKPIISLSYFSNPSPICVATLKVGTFCHFQKALRVPDWFVSLNNLPKIKGLGALCKNSLSTQDVRKGLILGMIVHYTMHHLFNISPRFSISILSFWDTKWLCRIYLNTMRMSTKSLPSHALWY